ncbi:hypothetical protein Pmar_PMAR027883, partial [Perkinsus marinus ATCC 50983]
MLRQLGHFGRYFVSEARRRSRWSREFRPMMYATAKMQDAENRFTISKDADTQECAQAIADFLQEPGQMVVLQMIGPDACAKAVRAAAYLRQQYKMELDLYFTTAPEGVVAYDKGAAEEIWVGLEVAEGPPPLAALIDFEISSKTFPDKLAWAVASHLFRGEAMRLTGIGPRSIIKMVTAIGIAAKWFDEHGRGVVLSR